MALVARLPRRVVLRCCGGWLLAACAALAAGTNVLAAEPRQPNIVLIMADDLGYGHLGCYGQSKIKTPHLDGLAKSGTRFTQWYSGSTVCAPSRSTLMTGLHTGHTPVRVNGGGYPLRAEDLTIAEVLKTRGYQNGLFGKWGLGDIDTSGVPWRQGFDESFGYLHQVHAHFYYPAYLYQNAEKFMLEENVGEQRVRYSHDEIAKQALDFMRRNRERPFFLYVPFTTPHTELLVPEDSLAEYRGKWAETPHVSKSHYAPQAEPRAAFAAMITRMDKSVGAILALLDELELRDDTLVIFTSDNGGQNIDGPDLEFFAGNGPLRGAKGNLFEGGIRVPCIVRWPGKVAAGATSDAIATHYDLFPTLAEVVGAAATPGLDGVSQVAAWTKPASESQPAAEPRFLYWELPGAKATPQAARRGPWKAIRTNLDKPIALYNLSSDIGETTDVAAEHPDVVAEFAKFFDTARTPPRPPLPGAPVRKKSDYVW